MVIVIHVVLHDLTCREILVRVLFGHRYSVVNCLLPRTRSPVTEHAQSGVVLLTYALIGYLLLLVFLFLLGCSLFAFATF